jgi:chromosome segregation ATPase
MARPLSTSGPHRGGTVNGNLQGRLSLDDGHGAADADALSELDHLRAENSQLRALCAELEQALHEATQQPAGPRGDEDWEERAREYDALLEEKTEMIRELHQQLQNAQDAVAEAENRANQTPTRQHQGPLPREEELLALSEELERERRQLQEDEQTLMEQMRTMEVSMARERAEMARQRNDLQRLYGEIRHELERLERNGALQSKIDGLKSKLQDATNRRGAAPTPGLSSNGMPAVPAQPAQPAPPAAPSKKEGLMSRFFGGKG